VPPPRPGHEITAEEMKRLTGILPVEIAIFEEAEFCLKTGCRPEQLERWLQNFWKQYDISAVLAGAERVSHFPTILGKQFDGYFTIRLFTPSTKLLRHSKQCRTLGSSVFSKKQEEN
jgi:hypothetical protein